MTTIIDHNDLLPALFSGMDGHLEILADQPWARKDSGVDAKLNYLYFLRDEVNKRIKAENRKRKAVAR